MYQPLKSNLLNCNLSVLHVNVQSITNKVCDLDTSLRTHPHDILCVSEHWLQNEFLETICIPNFHLITSYCRKGSNKHGGVAIFSRSNVCLKAIDVSTFCSQVNAEFCAAEIISINCVLLTVYRSSSHGDLSIFKTCFSNIIRYCFCKFKYIIIMGDFNLDLDMQSEYVSDLRNILTMYGLRYFIREPTRITIDNKSCLDNIITNLGPDIICTNVIEMHIADHLALSLRVNGQCTRKDEPVSYCTRIINDSTCHKFVLDLQLGCLHDFCCDFLNSNDSADLFLGTFVNIVNCNFPVMSKIRSNSGIRWFNSELKSMRRRLSQARRKFNASNLESDWISYCVLRKSYRKALKTTKRTCYNNFICNSNNKSRAVWQIVNTEKSSCSKNKSSLSPEEFNNFFVNVADVIINSIGNSDNLNPAVFLNKVPKPVSSFFLSAVDESDVREAILSLKNSSCFDYYGLNSKLLKVAIEPIVKPLSILFNKCIEDSIWPDCFKVTRVLPLHKKGDNNILDNFRPIAIVPVISKVFEILLKDKLLQYFESKSILSPCQFGFRNGRSTVGALLAVLENIVEGLDCGMNIHATLCDLSKAFDCVDVNVLLFKLEYYGIRSKELNLFRSYLSDRMQYVSIGDSDSEILPVSAGVPQGSVLGPILFLIYINDLPVNIQRSTCILFADDTTLLTRGGIDGSRGDLDNASLWFSANKLKLNMDKTRDITFTASKVSCNVDNVKLLGIYLDTRLTWATHIDRLCSKLARQVFFLRQLRSCVHTSTLKMLYFSLVHCHLSYGVALWGNATSALRAFVIQKAAIRLIGNATSRVHCRELFIHHKILPLPCLYVYEALSLVHKSAAHLQTHSDVHSYNTRHAGNLLLPYSRLNVTKSNKPDINLYNRFDNFCRVKHITQLSYGAFRRFIKSFLLLHCFYSVDEFTEYCSTNTYSS